MKQTSENTSSEALAFGVEPADRRYRLRLARYVAQAQAIRGHLQAPGARLLDVGVGRGRSRRYLQAGGATPALQWVGMDLTDHWFSHLRAAHAGWMLCQADAQRRWPFESASFDVVLCEQILEHLDDPAGALREARRVLKPGGLLVAGVPVFVPPIAWARRRWVTSSEHVQTFTARSFARLVRDAGFDVRSLRGFRVMSGGPLRPLEDHVWWYRLNGALGRRLPSWSTEVQVVAIRPASP